MRQKVVIVGIGVLFALLALGLFYTQVVRHGEYRARSLTNAIRIEPIEAPRGRMFDRQGALVVTNRLSLDIACVYQDIDSEEAFAGMVSGVFSVPPGRVREGIVKSRQRPFVPTTILEDVSKDDAMEFGERYPTLKGFFVESRPRREYPDASVGAHVVGYLGMINEQELDAFAPYGYRTRALVGRGGIEDYYNDYLMGTDGGLQVEVDARGRRVGVLGLKEASPGKDLYLTLDMRLQRAADGLLGKRKGAVVVMDPRDGQVLAMASHPTFDPAVFVTPGEDAARMRIVNGRSRPLLNRAVNGLYPPGSVFKLVIACAALETGKVSPGRRLDCDGSYSFAGATFRCWKESGHGPQGLVEAIKNSCNVYFYRTGKALGVDTIESYAVRFGFGRPTGIDLPDEAPGLVPGRLWKLLSRRGAWYEGETVNYAIGQGYLVATPLQVLRMTAAIANGGRLVRPHIVRRIGAVEVGSGWSQDVRLSDRTLRTVREGMLKVVNDPAGTGRFAKVEGLSIAGKTGTAQNPHGAPHAWFVGFAPFDRPTVAVVVLVEHGGKGGVAAAGIARGLFEAMKESGYL